MARPGGRRGVAVADLQTGNAAAGKRYFDGAGGCTRCHAPNRDLAGIASRYEGLELEERMLLYPRDAISKVTVTTKPSGEKFAGILAYRDEFTVGLRDASGVYRSWPVNRVHYAVDAPVEAHVDLFSKYTDDDIHNLMAYLQTLRCGWAQRPEVFFDEGSEPTIFFFAARSLRWSLASGAFDGRAGSRGRATGFILRARIRGPHVMAATPAAATSLPPKSRRRTSAITPWHGPSRPNQPAQDQSRRLFRQSRHGVLYPATVPDNIWAVDARSGHMIWHYNRPSKGEHTQAQRGVAMLQGAGSSSPHPTRT